MIDGALQFAVVDGHFPGLHRDPTQFATLVFVTVQTKNSRRFGTSVGDQAILGLGWGFLAAVHPGWLGLDSRVT